MITIEFGAAEKQTLDANSMFIKMYGSDFRENLEKIGEINIFEIYK